MSVYYPSFKYLGVDSRNKNLIITHLDGGDDGEVDSFLGMDPIYTENADGTRRLDYGAKYNNVAAPKITVIKQDGGTFSVAEIRDCLKWLTGSRKTSLLDVMEHFEEEFVSTGEDNRFTLRNKPDDVYAVLINGTQLDRSRWGRLFNSETETVTIELRDKPNDGDVVKIVYNKLKFSFIGRVTNVWQHKIHAKTVGLVIEFTSVSPWAMSPVYSKTFDVEGTQENPIEIKIFNESDDADSYVYMKTTYTNAGGSRLILTNTTTGEETEIQNLATQEIVVMESNQVITSDRINRKFGDDFNFIFPRLISGENIFHAVGTGEIKFEYTVPLKVGDCAIDLDSATSVICDDNNNIVIDTLDWRRISDTPSTLLGYGITDAYTKSEIDSIVSEINIEEGCNYAGSFHTFEEMQKYNFDPNKPYLFLTDGQFQIYSGLCIGFKSSYENDGEIYYKLTIITLDRGIRWSVDLNSGEVKTVSNFFEADQTYKPTSKNAQSGIAVAEAINNISVSDGYTPVKGVDYWTSADKQEIIEEIDRLKEYITPQMFGAVGDGETDDTAAIQAALNQGGYIYFPAGRYKVTSLLTASQPCKIEMFKQYPNCWITGDKGNYPLTETDNWMGSRIESYSTNGGMVLGSNVEVDGLFLRAMSGFTGVLLTYNDDVGVCKDYPATVRLSRIRLDINSTSTIVESMFDFQPNGGYNYILEDITIGRMRMTFCEYGFRTDLTKTSGKWANNVFIRNMCIDIHADYFVYVDGANRCGGWQFDGLTIQAYSYTPVINNNVGNGRTRHEDLITLKNMQTTLFVSCYLWDVESADVGRKFFADNITYVSCIGCSSEFEEIDTEFSARMGLEKNFNIKSLNMSLQTDGATGANTLTLSDNLNNQKQVTIPAAILSDEQVGNGVEKWMDENAQPTYTVGKNKLDLSSADNYEGYLNDSTGDKIANEKMITSHYIPVKNGDAIRSYLNSDTQMAWYRTFLFDANKNYLGYDTPANKKVTLADENVAYIRQCYTISTLGVTTFAECKTVKLTITINNTDMTYEPYTTTAEGGLGSYLVLSSPNGSKFTLAVNDNGEVIAKPVN